LLKECNYNMMHAGKPCVEPIFINDEGIEDSDGYCIFHSKDIKGKGKNFDEEFKRKFKEYDQDPRKEYDFTGYIFPNSLKFPEFSNEFSKSVYFSFAIFEDEIWFLDIHFNNSETLFNKVCFKEEAIFSGVIFTGNVNFSLATFLKIANFSGSKFKETTLFAKTNFYGELKFDNSCFSGDVLNFEASNFSGEKNSFSNSIFESRRTIFSNSVFKGASTSFKGAQFCGNYTKFCDVHFNSQKTCFNSVRFIGEFVDFNKSEFTGRIISFLYTRFTNNIYSLFSKGVLKKKSTFFKKSKYIIENKKLLFLFDSQVSSNYPILARKIKDAWYLKRFKEDHKITYFFWWLFADCGRSLKRWTFWSILMATGFAYKYFILGTEAFRIVGNLKHSFETMLYYSIVTFTTLGFGDITPQTKVAARWVMAEVILGYIMLGGLISILAVKLARRS